MSTINISSLPSIGTVTDVTYIPVETLGTTQKISGVVLKNFINTSLGSITSATIPGTLTLGNLVATQVQISSGNLVVSYGAIDNLSSGNAQISGGNAFFGVAVVNNFSSGNAQISGGNIATNYLSATNFSTGNAQISSAQISGGNASWMTETATNFSSGNAQISGGNSAWATLTATNLSSGNASISGGNSAWATLTATNLSSGNLRVSGAITPNANATINLGSTSAYWGNVITNGIMVGTGNILPNGNATVDIGSTNAWFGTIYGVSSQAKYADLAEKYSSDEQYDPATVVVFGVETEVTISKSLMDNKVAGVVTTNPAYLMNSESDGVAVALTGRVPCKVIGNITRGDMLVTSGLPGVATTVENPQLGTVIGKALENYNNNSTVGIIEVVVGRL